MKEVKHVRWSAVDGDGLIAVAVEYDYITFKKLAGNTPQASYLFSILDAAIPGWKQKAESLHLSRKHCWFVETRTSRFGSRDIILKIIRDYDLKDAPVIARLHISSFGKILDFEVWLGDLAPLAAEIKDLFPQAVLPPEEDENGGFWATTPEGHYLKLWVYDPKPINMKLIRFPGEPSGLLQESEENQETVPEISQSQEASLPEIEVI
jgi:hypothetical protein